MRPSVYVVVSGLPASGKTTLAQQLADRLDLPVIDKDTILEALFDSLGTGDRAWRYGLSRASDEVLWDLAGGLRRAVLANWWHRETAAPRLRQLGGRLIEVFCDCDPAVALRRFGERHRHRGHLDEALSPQQRAEQIARTRATYPGPLRLGGPLFVVDTSVPVDVDNLVAQLAHVEELGAVR